MATNPIKNIVSSNIEVTTFADKMHPISKAGYSNINDVPSDIKMNLTIPAGIHKGIITKDGTLYLNNGYFGALSYLKSEYKINSKSISKSPSLSLKNKIKNVFIENNGYSVRVKPIPTTILVLGLYLAYKKFNK